MWHQSQIVQDLQLSSAKEFKTLSLIQRQRVQGRTLTGRLIHSEVGLGLQQHFEIPAQQLQYRFCERCSELKQFSN